MAITHKQLSAQSKQLEQLCWPLWLLENLYPWESRDITQGTWAIKPSLWMEVRSFCRQILQPAAIRIQVLLEWYVLPIPFKPLFCKLYLLLFLTLSCPRDQIYLAPRWKGVTVKWAFRVLGNPITKTLVICRASPSHVTRLTDLG